MAKNPPTKVALPIPTGQDGSPQQGHKIEIAYTPENVSHQQENRKRYLNIECFLPK
jgi:hypothetical protein